MVEIHYLIYICFSIIWAQSVYCMSMISPRSYFMDARNANNDVVDIIMSKRYIPSDKSLPKTFVKSGDNEVTYLLSKLTDDELIRLLNEQPKKTEYDLNDVVKLAFDSKSIREEKLKSQHSETKSRDVFNGIDNQLNSEQKRFRTITAKNSPQIAVFRLNDKRVDPYNIKLEADPNYTAIQKLSNMLYSRQLDAEKDEKYGREEEKKELLFDVLVSQLKMLCCKNTKSNTQKYQSLIGNLPSNVIQNSQNSKIAINNEQMFLIVNDEIKSNGSDELISVDPESLDSNSSVLLLGPITTPLTDSQLKLVMYRISNELSKPEYLPLLQQLSAGSLSGNNMKLMKSLATGPETRRYIKPHRCNHQSHLAKVYGGPKWLICTGYLNLNTPSLYDKKK